MKIYKKLFSPEFCDSLIKTIKNECVLSEWYKMNWYIWLIWGQQPSQQLEMDKWNNNIMEIVKDELRKTEFDIDSHRLTWLQMTEYENNRWLREHVDGYSNNTLIIILTDNFIGGDTMISNEKINLDKGDGVFFRGHNTLHGVSPVTDGVRNALNFWFK